MAEFLRECKSRDFLNKSLSTNHCHCCHCCHCCQHCRYPSYCYHRYHCQPPLPLSTESPPLLLSSLSSLSVGCKARQAGRHLLLCAQGKVHYYVHSSSMPQVEGGPLVPAAVHIVVRRLVFAYAAGAVVPPEVPTNTEQAQPTVATSPVTNGKGCT